MIVGSQQTHNCWSCFWLSAWNGLVALVSAIWQRIWPSAAPQTSPVYAFSQQSNPDCHLRMWRNFQQLQEYRGRQLNGGGAVEIGEEDFLSHRDWLGGGFAEFDRWLQAKNQPALREYLQDSLQEAPLYPHFYDSRGNNFFQENAGFFERGERRCLSPFFMKRAEQGELTQILPFYEEGGRYLCYDRNEREYREVPDVASIDQLQQSDLTPGQRQALPHNFTTLRLAERKSGNRTFITAINPSIAVEAGLGEERFVPRELGTYKLLLLNLGLDHRNESIPPQHGDYRLVEELRETMAASETAWDPALCQKERLMEYEIAEIFKEDPQLFNRVRERVDFYFSSWSRYENELTTLRDQRGEALNDKNWQRYLPGREQMLAYCLMKNVQYLWVDAISSTAFCHHIGMPGFVKHLPLMVGPARYRRAAYVRQGEQSFIDVWQEVRGRLREKFPDRQDWVSFSGHGMVVSFDADLIQRQNERQIHSTQLATDLGFAGIDSLHAKEMDLFYKRVQ